MANNRRKKDKNYFMADEEKAVIDYLSTDSKEEKYRIYREKLEYPFTKMIESIIRRYKLFVPDEDFNDVFNDTMSFLFTKLDKFKPGKYKAYSYYGTICKNHLLGKMQEYNKELNRNPSYELMYNELNDNIEYSDAISDSNAVAKEVIDRITNKIGEMLDNKETYKLKENEIVVGKALKNLLENWDYVLTTDGSNKLNKNAILLFLRDETGFDTRGVRDGMKKYKKVFLEVKSSVVE